MAHRQVALGPRKRERSVCVNMYERQAGCVRRPESSEGVLMSEPEFCVILVVENDATCKGGE